MRMVFLTIEPEVRRAMGYEWVELLERSCVHEQVDSLSRREFPSLVLRIYASLTTSQQCLFALLEEFVPSSVCRFP